MVEATSRTCGDQSGETPNGARELLARLLERLRFAGMAISW